MRPVDHSLRRHLPRSRAAALDRQGIILQSNFLIADDLRRDDLVELLPPYRTMTLGIHAVYPSRKYLPI